MSKKPHKISVITDYFVDFSEGGIGVVPRGSNILLYGVMRFLREKFNIQLDVYQMGENTGREEFEGINIFTIKSDTLQSYDEIYKQIDPQTDIIHYNNIDFLYNRKSTIVTGTIHTNAFLENKVAKQWLLENMYNFDKLVVVNNGYVKEFNELGDKIQLIKNGIPLEIFDYQDKDINAIKNGCIPLFFPNLDSPKKNREFVFPLMEALNKNSNQKFKLILPGFKGGLNVDDSVYEFVGHVGYGDEMVKLYHDTYITLIPSLSESCSLCALESMACGSVVIANDIIGISSYIDNGVNGLLLSVNNIDQWVTVIKQLLENPLEYSTISKHARRIVKREYNIENTALKYYKMWEGLLNE